MNSYRAENSVPHAHQDTAGLSFIGGTPTKGEKDWPTNPEMPNEPLHLVAQLSCEDIHRSLPTNPLPNHGVLQFFLDMGSFVDCEERPVCRFVRSAAQRPKKHWRHLSRKNHWQGDVVISIWQTELRNGYVGPAATNKSRISSTRYVR
ncbi:DUF1963 domain-containing protein [Phaeobacter sp. C3_T13_0]|uniref:DUF1963 domain-containing protein n=1 Tax=Phaeobacter cretensis TaxID=3342641 RepID=UPI0039BC39C6